MGVQPRRSVESGAWACVDAGAELNDPGGSIEPSDRMLAREVTRDDRSSEDMIAGAVPERVILDVDRGRPGGGTGSPPGLVMAELSEYVDCVDEGGADADAPSSMTTLSASAGSSIAMRSDDVDVATVVPEPVDASFLCAPLTVGYALPVVAERDTTLGGSVC